VQHGPNLFCAKALRVGLTSDDLRRGGGSAPMLPGIQANTLEPLNVIRGVDPQVSHKTGLLTVFNGPARGGVWRQPAPVRWL